MLLWRAWLSRPVELKAPVRGSGRHGRFHSAAKSMYVRVYISTNSWCVGYGSPCIQAGIAIAV